MLNAPWQQPGRGRRSSTRSRLPRPAVTRPKRVMRCSKRFDNGWLHHSPKVAAGGRV